MDQELKACRNCGGKCDPTGWMSGDGRQGPECEGCGITTPDVESWNRLMGEQATSQVGEAVEVVAHLVLGGIFHGGSGPELGDIDYQIEVDVAERLQLENVKTSEDVQLELMTVAQHQRILSASAPKAGAAVATDAFVPGSLADLLFQLGEKGIGVSGGTHGDHWRVSSPYTHPADQAAEPGAAQEIQWLEQWLLLAAEPIGQECCGQAYLECCGNAEPVYRTADEIAVAMNARREELRALLAKP